MNCRNDSPGHRHVANRVTFLNRVIFPVGPKRIPGKVRPRFVLVMAAFSFTLMYVPNRPRVCFNY